MRVAPQGADLDPAFLDLFVELLHKLAPALFVERGDVQADDGAVVARRESEI